MTSFKSIWNFTLIPTGAAQRRDGSCVMEAVSWLSTGDLNRDVPGVCPIIRAQAIAITDSFPDTHRQDLRGFIPQLIGTADPPSYLERHAYLCRQTLRLYASLILRYYDLPLDEDHLRLFTEFRDTGKVIPSSGFTSRAAR